MAIIIAAKRHGFRRCGIAHSSEPTLYRDDHFTAAQLQRLGKDPQLVVSYVDADLDDQQELLNGTSPIQKAGLSSEITVSVLGKADIAAMGDTASKHQDVAILGQDHPSLAGGLSRSDIEGLWEEALLENSQRDAFILSTEIETLWAAALLEDLQRTADKQAAEINALWEEALAEEARRATGQVKDDPKPQKKPVKPGSATK